MTTTYAVGTYSARIATAGEGHLSATQRVSIAKKLRTANTVAFALVSLAVLVVVSIVSLPAAALVGLPLVALTGVAQYRGQDEWILRELDRIEMEIATID